MLEVLRHAALLSLLWTAVSHARPSEGGPGASSASTPNSSVSIPQTVSVEAHAPVSSGWPSHATCISRTVNYITHTLPQQCLRTDRLAAHGTQTTANSTVTCSSVSETSASSAALAETPASTLQGIAGTINNGTETANFTTTVGPSDQRLSESGLASSTADSSVRTITSESATPATLEPEAEADSPLDNANFLSFDEWKKQNLAKAGQSPEHVGQERQATNANRQRPGISNALDTLGEESEIDLDFSGFGGARSSSAVGDQSASSASSDTAAAGQSSPGNTPRSKDAGKTCKERTNYASFDCAATILKSNPECKHASSVLVENKDSYMLNTCSAKNKFIIIELCNDILIDTIVLANYEFFSSIFRHFRVSVSDRYPVKVEKWKDLGTFEARSTREVQAFLIENPLIWARYLRIEFLTHYGSEYYCPLSLLRVHGTTMMEEFRHQEEMSRGDVTDDERTPEPEETGTPFVVQEPFTSIGEGEKATARPSMPTEDVSPAEFSTPASNANDTAKVSPTGHPAADSTLHSTAVAIPTISPELELPTSSELTCAPSASSGEGLASPDEGDVTLAPTYVTSRHQALSARSSIVEAANATQPAPIVTSEFGNTIAPPKVTASSNASDMANNQTHSSEITDAASATGGSSAAGQQFTTVSSVVSPANSTRSVASSTTVSHQPQPSTQESFFKSIHKRLQQLESNSTLSLQYIEEQSRILRDAFTKVEKRQISATTTFLSHLNETVMAELHGFRQAYDQLWQSTVLELEGQREQYQREMLALSTRLTLVADELVWQKRMGIVQSTLLLLCLGLVLFARQGHGYLELPLAQQLMLKSQAALRAGWESEPNSPSPTSRSPVSIFRRKLWRSSAEPAGNGNLTDATETESRPVTRNGGPDVQIGPPTASTDGASSDAEESAEDQYEDVLATQSGPTTPNGSGAGLKRPPDRPGEARTISPLR
ncbi:hypothetical protein LTR36_009426 [Oleoguttula mirabilis]|uniref:SUN domain-containing protein n=1 Tax=Oleoguttula mirabilis TaxID=1507867 RepID=A0AAV9JTW3_9PEZI|nr:hypothetical protein LTR36_009426 [Oleoguttula mirabilis]